MLINTSIKIHLLIALICGIWLTAFLVFVGPYDSAELSIEWRARVMFGYGLSFILAYAIIIPFQQWLSKAVNQKVWLFELICVASIILIGLFTALQYYESSIINGDWGIKRFVLEIYLPTNLIFVPILVFCRWLANKSATKAKSKTKIKTEKQQINDLQPRITQLMHDKIYLDPNLSLKEMSQMLESNNTVLSNVINQGYSLNFNDFINKFRIEAVIEALKNGDQEKTTLQGIAEDCGFNSKATFNRAFKKQMDITPREYIQSLEGK